MERTRARRFRRAFGSHWIGSFLRLAIRLVVPWGTSPYAVRIRPRHVWGRSGGIFGRVVVEGRWIWTPRPSRGRSRRRLWLPQRTGQRSHRRSSAFDSIIRPRIVSFSHLPQRIEGSPSVFLCAFRRPFHRLGPSSVSRRGGWVLAQGGRDVSSPPGSNPGRFPFRTRNESGSTSFLLGDETERAWTKGVAKERRTRTCGEGAGGGRARGGGTRTRAMEARTNGGSAGEEVRTLFISGLPSDVKEREIYLLFRSVPGYEGCRLSLLGRDQTPVAFAVFDTQATCMDVIQDLNGIRMDPASSITLRIELAKSNSRPKKYRPEGENAKPTSNGGGLESRGNSSGNLQGITFGAVGESSTSLWSGGLPGLGWSGITETGDTYDTIGLAAQTQAQQNLSIFANPTPNPVVSAATGGRTPIPTLFVGNLNPNCTEAELREVFNLCPGFRDIHMQFKTHAPVAFVDFENVECSTQALNSLQGLQLKSGPGSEPGVGMRIEFARSRTRT